MFDLERPRRVGVEDAHIAYLHGLFAASMRARRYQDARDTAETLVQLDPFNSKSWLALAGALRAQGKGAMAEAAEEFAACL